MAEKPTSPYWFPAKRYGWGWGLPATWQGWVVMLSWMAAVISLSGFIAGRSILMFYVFIAIMAGLLIAVCYWKGEPPKWRWGN